MEKLALNIEQLYKRYQNGVEALKGINLNIKEGDFFALLGPNGAGKSTTIGIICSLINKTRGTIKVFGKDIDTDWAEAKSYIGFMPQEMNFNIFERIEDIVVNQAGYYGVPKRIALERAEFYLKAVDLWDKRHHVARSLSGGMKRRLMLARAMIHEPKLLILDEPTAGVDIEIRRSLWDFIKQLNEKGVTIILTTHYLEEAENLCRHIAIIDKGQIIEHTDRKTLLSKLQSENFILDTVNTLSSAPELSGFATRWLEPHTLEVEVPNTRTMNELFTALTQQGITVKSLRNKTNRLEELFLRLTHHE